MNKKFQKIIISFIMALSCVFIFKTSALASSTSEGYLKRVEILQERRTPNILENFQSNNHEYYVQLSQDDISSLMIQAFLSEHAPIGSKCYAKYVSKSGDYSWETSKNIDTDEEDPGYTLCSNMLNNSDEGCKFNLEVGSEDDIQIYTFYVLKKNTSATNLTNQLKELPEISVLTVSDKEAVTSAKEAYEALTDEQKSYMQPSLIQKLTDAEEKIAELEKEAADQEAAGKVIDEIKAVNPETATLEELKKVQADYDALTAEQKAIVDADPAAVSAKKAIDAKVVELNKPAEQPTEEKPTESKPADTKPVADKTVSVKKGATFTVKGYKYKVTSNLVKNPTVTVTGYKNKKLSKITVPATVTYKKVKFKVTAVSANAFKGQKKAKTAYLGSNVKSIGSKAFYGDSKIKKITVKSSVLTKVGSKAFKGIAKKAVIKVPSKKLKAYKKLMKGKGQAKTVKITK